jgi:hypothetical protein
MPLIFENTEKIPNSNTGYHTKNSYFLLRKLRKTSLVLMDITSCKYKSPTQKNRSLIHCLLTSTNANICSTDRVLDRFF